MVGCPSGGTFLGHWGFQKILVGGSLKLPLNPHPFTSCHASSHLVKMDGWDDCQRPQWGKVSHCQTEAGGWGGRHGFNRCCVPRLTRDKVRRLQWVPKRSRLYSWACLVRPGLERATDLVSAKTGQSAPEVAKQYSFQMTENLRLLETTVF